jgi:hypothetical protein
MGCRGVWRWRDSSLLAVWQGFGDHGVEARWKVERRRFWRYITWFPEQLLVTEERVSETLMPRKIKEFEYKCYLFSS